MIISVSLGGLRPRLLAAPEPFMQPDGAARGGAFLAPEGASGAGIILAGRCAPGRGAAGYKPEELESQEICLRGRFTVGAGRPGAHRLAIGAGWPGRNGR